MNKLLTDDTKAIILLCGILGNDRSVKPLAQREYSRVVCWLIGRNLRPASLLIREHTHSVAVESGLDVERLTLLLDRGVQLGFAVENWHRNGIWVISRSDQDYPARYKRHLKDKAPPLLFGVGDRSLLRGGGVAIVGSRNIDPDGEGFTREVGELCALNKMPVVSGGARGVDQIVMKAALDAKGVVVGVLVENLLRKSTERYARNAISDGRLLLISPYHPEARFTVGTAMGRNKLIYTMADYGLVVSVEYKKGGTWAGAEEELKRSESLPIFVRVSDGTPVGNKKLLDLGAIVWPNNLKKKKLNKQLDEAASKVTIHKKTDDLNLFDVQIQKPSVSVDIDKELKTIEKVEENSEQEILQKSVYEAIVPIILAQMSLPITIDELAKQLDVSKKQLNVWLKRAVEEHKIMKLSRPVRYCKMDI